MAIEREWCNESRKYCLEEKLCHPVICASLFATDNQTSGYKNLCETDKEFFEVLPSKGIAIIEITVNHPSFGGFIISFVGVCWLLLAIVIALGFKGAQAAGFKSAGEKITIEDSPNDSGATFLVTYVLPLLTDDIESLRGLFVFATMLIMVILLLSRSNTFYQNPVLVAMKYRSFSFKFDNPDDDILPPNRLYIGITKGLPFEEDKIIKRKYIADGVFVIFNE